eukprot:jgi/Chlat1/5671/Chrsp37S05488
MGQNVDTGTPTPPATPPTPSPTTRAKLEGCSRLISNGIYRSPYTHWWEVAASPRHPGSGLVTSPPRALSSLSSSTPVTPASTPAATPPRRVAWPEEAPTVVLLPLKPKTTTTACYDLRDDQSRTQQQNSVEGQDGDGLANVDKIAERKKRMEAFRQRRAQVLAIHDTASRGTGGDDDTVVPEVVTHHVERATASTPGSNVTMDAAETPDEQRIAGRDLRIQSCNNKADAVHAAIVSWHTHDWVLFFPDRRRRLEQVRLRREQLLLLASERASRNVDVLQEASSAETGSLQEHTETALPYTEGSLHGRENSGVHAMGLEEGYHGQRVEIERQWGDALQQHLSSLDTSSELDAVMLARGVNAQEQLEASPSGKQDWRDGDGRIVDAQQQHSSMMREQHDEDTHATSLVWSKATASRRQFDPGDVTWDTQAVPSNPGPRARAGHASASWGENLLITGGAGLSLFSTWQLDACTLSWRKRRAEGDVDPAATNTAASAYTSATYVPGNAAAELEACVMLFGGWREPDGGGGGGNVGVAVSADLYVLEGLNDSPDTPLTWSKIPHEGRDKWPQARAMHAAELLNDRILVVGGWTGGGAARRDFLSDVWQLDVVTLQWERVELKGVNLPVGRAGHTATHVHETGQVYILGGHNELGPVAIVGVFDPATRHWIEQPSTMFGPCARSGHAAIACRGTILIHGGCDAVGNVLSDMWILHTTSLTLSRVEIEQNHPRSGHSAILIGGHRVVIVGGLVDAHRGVCAAGNDVVVCLRTHRPCVKQLRVIGGPLHSTVRAASYALTKHESPQLRFQWYRQRNGCPCEVVAGATLAGYLPTADDIGCLLGVSCRAGDSSFFARSDDVVQLDPHVASIINDWLARGYAEFSIDVSVTQRQQHQEHKDKALSSSLRAATLRLFMDRVKLKLCGAGGGGATAYNGAWRPGFVVSLLHKGDQGATFEVRFDVRGPVVHAVVLDAAQRDLLALACRAFWAAAMARPQSVPYTRVLAMQV